MKTFSAIINMTIMTALLFSTGCEFIKKLDEENAKRKIQNKPQYVLSVHQIVKNPRANMLEKKIPTFSGRTIWVNVNPFIHSRNIKKIELIERKDQKMSPFQKLPPVPKKNDENSDIPKKRRGKNIDKQDENIKFEEDEPKFYDLKLYLDRRGALAWMQLSAGFRYKKVALLIDGVFYRSFCPKKVSTENDEFVILEGPIDETCAFQIRKYAKKNYKLFKDKKKEKKSDIFSLF